MSDDQKRKIPAGFRPQYDIIIPPARRVRHRLVQEKEGRESERESKTGQKEEAS